MATAPFNPANDAGIVGADGLPETRSFIAHWRGLCATADTDGVLAAVTDNGTERVISAGITNPTLPRNITALPGGTAGDIAAIQVVIAGTNIKDEVITETLPVFTADTATGVAGLKCFKTVTSITIPAHTSTGATTEIGWGDKMGLRHTLARNTVLMAFEDGALEGTPPTVTVHATTIESNGFTTNTAPGGNIIDVYYLVDGEE